MTKKKDKKPPSEVLYPGDWIEFFHRHISGTNGEFLIGRILKQYPTGNLEVRVYRTSTYSGGLYQTHVKQVLRRFPRFMVWPMESSPGKTMDDLWNEDNNNV